MTNWFWSDISQHLFCLLFFTLLVNIMKNMPNLHLSILGGEHCFIGAFSVFICTFCVGIRAIKTNALIDHLQRPAPLSYFCFIQQNMALCGVEDGHALRGGGGGHDSLSMLVCIEIRWSWIDDSQRYCQKHQILAKLKGFVANYNLLLIMNIIITLYFYNKIHIIIILPCNNFIVHHRITDVLWG